MKSHMMNQETEHQTLMSDEHESASSASYTDDENDEKGMFLSYGLRDNPRKSFGLVDFDPGSVVLQYKESETETSKNLRRRRSKRTRKSSTLFCKNQEHAPPKLGVDVVENVKEKVDNKLDNLNWVAEAEPVSSISDATTEEDLASCLMMLSRDKWTEKHALNVHYEEDAYDDEYEDDETEESEEPKMCTKNRSSRGKYKCETCNRVFRSYQALGGHRASHKKIKVASTNPVVDKVKNAASTSSLGAEKKIYKCPFCSRVFVSGQALGGHKRSHFSNGGGGVVATATLVATPSASTRFEEHFIDLNLPPPIEEDGEFNQVLNPIEE